MFIWIGWIDSTSLFSWEVLIDCMIFQIPFSKVPKDFYVDNFFPRTARLWNSLPTECLPLKYNLKGFMFRVNRHLWYVGSIHLLSNMLLLLLFFFYLLTQRLLVAVFNLVWSESQLNKMPWSNNFCSTWQQMPYTSAINP